MRQFRYLGTLITEDGRCVQEIKSRIAMAKNSFNRLKELLSRSMKISTKKRIIKSLVWSVFLYGAETWTLRREDMKRINALETWIWRRVERVSWTEKKSNEEILERVQEKRCLLERVIHSKKRWIGHIVRGEGLLKEVIEGRMEGKRPRGRKRIGMLQEIKEGTYGEMKRSAENKTEWRRWMPDWTCLRTEN